MPAGEVLPVLAMLRHWEAAGKEVQAAAAQNSAAAAAPRGTPPHGESLREPTLRARRRLRKSPRIEVQVRTGTNLPVALGAVGGPYTGH